MKTLKNSLLIIVLILAFGCIDVYAATAHQFSFKAYSCEGLNEGLECTTEPELLPSDGTGTVNQGSIIKLELYYVPGTQVDKSMQVGFWFNKDQLNPVYDGGELLIQPAQPPYFGGIYPPKGTSTSNRMFTNWTIMSNQDDNEILLIIKDTMMNDPLTTEGVLTSLYFEVKSNATPGELLDFTYDQPYTMFANESQIEFTDLEVKVYKLLDTDTTLSNITVTNGGTNYLSSFNKNTKTYTVYVPNSVSTVDVIGTPTKTTTTVTDGSNQSLTVSTNKAVSLLTTAENGDTDTYTVNVYRLSNNANLSGLTLSNVSFGQFNSGTTSYTATVPYTTTSTNVSATKADAKATVSGTGTKQLAVGSNTVSVVVSPENCKSEYSGVPNNTCTTKTYTVTVTREAPATNANLATLTVDGVSVPNFDANTLTYTLDDVVFSKETVEIAATSAESHATITGTGVKNLSVGNNALKVKVTAQDGTTEKEYTINIKRKSNDATLKSLSVTSSDGSLSPSFSPNTTEYTYSVGPDVSSVSITGVKNHTGANIVNGTATIDPTSVTSHTITVVSEDGSQTNNYVITINRTKSANANLSALSVTGRTISPSFDASTLTYTLTVPSTVNTVTINATKADNRATMTGDGEKTLTTGLNTFPVRVVAENGTTEKTYNVKVTKQSGDADLSSLTLSGITYTPSFDANTLAYTATVPYTTSSTEVTGVKHDTKASITGNGTKQLSVGSNTIKVKVTAEDTNISKEYVVTVTREAASTNADLATLTVDGVSVPNFDANTLSYTLDDVVFTKNSVEVGATTAESHATITGTGTKTLSLGNNALKVKVTAQDGTTSKEYTINIKRRNNDATLKSLSVTSSDGSLSPSFSPTTTAYTYTVGPDVTSVTITGTKNDTNANLIGNATINPLNTTEQIITVTSEDGTEVNNYVITINRTKSDNANLSALGVTGYTLSPSFNADTLDYTLTVPSTVDSVVVTATRADTRASMTGDGNKLLTTGLNTFPITVTAENGTTSKTYNVKITKQSGDADLSSLTLSDVSYTPTFDANTLSYTATVPYTTSSTEVTGVKHDSKASLTGNGTKQLSVGENTIKVKVTAEDTSISKEYVVVVTREAASTDANLATLTVDDVSVPNFDANTLTYTLDDVAYDKDSVVIGATSSEEHATITGTGTKSLALGNNALKVKVTAQDGTTDKEYTINIRRNNNEATLSGLTVSGLDLDPTFDPDETEYTATVDSTVDSITINATPTDENSDVDGDGTIQLNTGDNRIPVTVTSEDGTEDKTYYINVHKNNDDATLSSLELSGINYGTFDSATHTYSVTVPYTTSNTTVSATPTDANALVYDGTGNIVLNVGENTITVKVKAEDRNIEDSYTVTVTREAASTNAKLLDLTVDGTTIAGFNEDTFEYFLTYNNSKESIELGATADPTASVDGTGTKTLAVKDNTFVITVTSQSNDSLEYTVHVRRQSNDSTLKSLSVTSDDGSLDKSFDPTETEYTYTVGPNVTSVTVSGVQNDNDATVTPETTINPQETDKVTLRVTAEDGSYKDYVINMVRTESSNADLSGLSVEGYNLNEQFDPNTTEYTVTVPNDVESINIIATKADDRADVDGDGTKPVQVGPNTFVITVTAEDDTPKEYTLVVTRAESGDNTLSALTIDGEPIEGFDPAITDYTLDSVTNDKDSINIGTTTNDPNASVEGDGNIPLSTGTNDIPIKVTAPDGTENTYWIHVTRVQNDNNYLSALSIEGISLNEQFDKTSPDYTANIPANTTTVNVTATPEVETSTPSGDIGTVNITSDVQILTITVTSEANTTREYTITLTKVSDDEFITSIQYGHDIDDTYILSGNLNAKVSNMKDELDNDNAKLQVWKADESEQLTDNDYIATGYIVKLVINGVEKDRKIIVIKGDTNGDSELTLIDAVGIAYHYVKTQDPDSPKSLLTGAYLKAAYVGDDDEITLLDAVGVAYHYVRKEGKEIQYKTKYTR